MRYFMSYSRQQLYFTEILAQRLQNLGVDIWFDLQQLEPGCDWRTEIDRGLASCDGLIFVASPSAIESPYVEKEWRTMLDHGKPVYIAYRETARLNQALQNLPTYDMRGFQPDDARCFVDFLKGEGPAKAVRWLWWPPRDLWLILLSLLTPLYFGFQQLTTSTYTLPSPVSILLIAAMIYLFARYWRDTISYRNLRLAMMVVNSIAFPLLILQVMLLFGGGGAKTLAILLGIPAALLPLWTYRSVMPHSQALLCWLRPHIDTQELREAARGWHQSALKNQSTRRPWETYRLYAAPGDAPETVEYLEMLLRKAGFKKGHQADTTDFCIAFVSNLMPQNALISLFSAYRARFIGILLSPVEFEGEVSEVKNFQIVDMRDRDRRRLDYLVAALKDSGLNAEYALATVPKPLERHIYPAQIVWLLRLIRWWGTLIVGFGLYGLLVNLGIQRAIEIPNISTGRLVLFVLIGAGYFALLDAIDHRSISYPMVTAGLLALSIAFVGLLLSVVEIDAKAIRYVIFLLAFAGFGLWNFSKPLKEWLPQNRGSGDTLRWNKHLRNWLGYALLSAVTALFLALMPREWATLFRGEMLIVAAGAMGWVFMVYLLAGGGLLRMRQQSEAKRIKR